MNLIKRIFRLFGKRAYMLYVKPCPCCGARNILFKRRMAFLCGISFVCEDCGFEVEGFSADYVLRTWDQLPRKKEDK